MSRVFIDTTTISATSPATVTITPQQSGSTFIINKATVLVNLPSPTIAGLKFRFYNNNAVSVLVEIFSIAGTGTMDGMWTQLSGAKTLSNAFTQEIDFTATSIRGDYVDCISDGTFWRVEGQTGVAGGFQFN